MVVIDVVENENIVMISAEEETEKEQRPNDQVVVSLQSAFMTYHRSLVMSGQRDLWRCQCGWRFGNTRVAIAAREVAKQSGANQCKLCFKTTAWPCNICKQKKPRLDFTMWRWQHGTGKGSIETCNSCLGAEAGLNQNVRIFCPHCHVGRDVRLNLFWEREGGNRFKKLACLSRVCALKHHYRVDHWLRRPHDVDNTIKAWLAHNNASKKDICHDTMTAELYKSQIVTQVDQGKHRKCC